MQASMQRGREKLHQTATELRGLTRGLISRPGDHDLRQSWVLNLSEPPGATKTEAGTVWVLGTAGKYEKTWLMSRFRLAESPALVPTLAPHLHQRV